MGLNADQLKTALDVLAAREPALAAALGRVGYPEPRISPRGYATLLRTIIGQQVSTKAAQSVWHKLEGIVGDLTDPGTVTRATDEQLREAGLSRQKAGYARSLSALVTSGELDLVNLPADDEDAIAKRWSRSRVSGAGRRRSICCSPKVAPISGRPVISRCRSKSVVSLVTKPARARN